MDHSPEPLSANVIAFPGRGRQAAAGRPKERRLPLNFRVEEDLYHDFVDFCARRNLHRGQALRRAFELLHREEREAANARRQVLRRDSRAAVAMLLTVGAACLGWQTSRLLFSARSF